MKLISRLWKLCLNEDYDQGAFLKPKLNLILKKNLFKDLSMNDDL